MPSRVAAAVVSACALAATLAAAPASAAPASAAPASAATADDALEVSFTPQAAVRLEGERFVSRRRADASAANDALAGRGVVRVQRLFDEPPASLDAVRARLIADGRRDVPDLNRHYRIVATGRPERDRLLASLRSLAIVAEAVPEPGPVPPPTANYTGRQRYALAAPGGINTGAVAGVAGGLGQNVKIVDIEYAWNRAHEDLAAASPASVVIPNGTPSDPFPEDKANHGTAVLGELIATANGFGVTGLAHGSEIGLVNANTTTGYAPANAVNVARVHLSAGDVILLEQQAVGIGGTGSEAEPFVPSEYTAAVYDAVRLATQTGIVVVEAAGNGGVDLDAPAYAQPFPDGKPDSGAIVVGAGSGDCSAPANSRLSFSSFGSRVNLQGWGQCVATTGYGTLFDGGPNALYASAFNGTSSAAPIVAAAAAVYSSVFEAAAGRPPGPLAVRQRLIATGTAQAAAASGHIGPLPNLLAAANGFDFTPPTVSIGAGPSGLTNDPTPAFAFAASEAGSTFECRVDAGAFAACASPHATAALADGGHTIEVRATDAALNPGPPASRAFTVDTVAPTVSFSSGPSGPTSATSHSFAFAASEAGSTLECSLDGAAYAPCTSPQTTLPLADGAHAFSVKATDLALNPGVAAARAFTVDTTGPSVSFGAGPAGPTNDATPSFAFAASEAGSTFECSLDGAAFAACTSPRTTPALTDGAHAFSVQATDALLNPGPATRRAFAVDTVAPAVEITSGPSGSTSTATPAFEFAGQEPDLAFSCRAGPAGALGAFAACASPHTTTPLANGATVFEVRATDVAGNEGPAASRAFTVAVPPPPPAAGATVASGEAESPLSPVSPPALGSSPPVLGPPAIGPGTRLTVDVPAAGSVRLARPTITCPALPPSCSVTAKVERVGAGNPVIATATSTIAAGKRATIHFKLSPSARALLRRRGRLAARVRITARHGALARTRTVQLALRRAR